MSRRADASRAVTFVAAAAVLASACSGSSRPASSAAGPIETTVSAQAPAPAVTPASTFDATRAWAHLEKIVGFGPRPSGSAALQETRAYILEQLKSYGLAPEEQRFRPNTPNGPTEMVNIIVRIPGRRTDRILLTGHYDTKLMKNARFVGASDGGSSAAFLLEAARALAGKPGELTYELVWFDGEEATCAGWDECSSNGSPDNTYGSRHYVESARTNKTLTSIKAMILVDMIGDRDLELRRDLNSTPWLVDAVWSTARRLALDHIFVETTTSVTDDHMPFLAAGVPSVDLIDLDTYPYWHTPDDTIDKVSARSLQVVGDVVLNALPSIEARVQ